MEEKLKLEENMNGDLYSFNGKQYNAYVSESENVFDLVFVTLEDPDTNFVLTMNIHKNNEEEVNIFNSLNITKYQE